MILYTTVKPGEDHYLPPTQYADGEPPTRDCGSIAPPAHFGRPWQCTREEGHEGDHAVHSALSRTPDMVARWDGRAESRKEG